MMRCAVALLLSLLAGGTALADDAAACGHPVPDRSIRGCTLLIDRGEAAPALLADHYLQRGIAYLYKQDRDRALADFDQSIRLVPSATAHMGRAVILGDRSNFRDAIAELDRAIALDPKHPAAHGFRGKAYGRLAEPDREKEDRERFERLMMEAWNPMFSGPPLFDIRTTGLGQIQHFLQALEAEFAQFDKAILESTSAAEPYVRRAEAYLLFGAGQFDRALADYEQAIRVNPGFAKAYVGRGRILYAQGQPARAFDDFVQALTVDPRHAEAHLRLAIVYAARDETERAIASLDAAIGLAPKLAEAYFHRGSAYEKIGERDKALGDFLKVRALGRVAASEAVLVATRDALKRLGAR